MKKILIPFLISFLLASSVSADTDGENGLLKKFPAALPVTEKITKEVVSLPIHPELNLTTHKKIIKILNSFEATLK